VEILFEVGKDDEKLEFHSLGISLGEEKSVRMTAMSGGLGINEIFASSSKGFIDFLHHFTESLTVGDGDR